MLWDLFLIHMLKITKLVYITVIIVSFVGLLLNAHKKFNSKLEIRPISNDLQIVNKYLSIRTLLNTYNSPIEEDAHSFTEVCKTIDVDCYLLPSIAGLESGFGKHIAPGSYNPFGWGKGYIYFDSWSSGINIVGNSIKKNYIDKGYKTTYEISHIYAPSSTTWYINVDYFRKKLYNEELRFQKYLSIIHKI